MKRLFFFVYLAFCLSFPSRACTAFCYSHDGLSFLAKNLDWPVDDGMIFFNRSGISKSAFTAGGPAVAWTSKYSSISVNQFGKEFPLGGMNTRGLVVEELNMPAVQLQGDRPKRILNEFQVVQYILDNFATVAEVEIALSEFRPAPLFLSLHYLLMDQSGGIRIMEFDGSSFVFYKPREAQQAVLSNNPYKESLRYLKHFKRFGGGQNIQHRNGSNERFVSVAYLLALSSEAGAVDEPVNHCFNILDTVSQPDTRWSLVYDPGNLCVHIKFHSCTCRQKISLMELVKLPESPSLGAEIGWCKGNANLKLEAITKEENQGLMETLWLKLKGELDLKHRTPLYQSMITYSNSYIFE